MLQRLAVTIGLTGMDGRLPRPPKSGHPRRREADANRK
jgi:hypothetical protein